MKDYDKHSIINRVKEEIFCEARIITPQKIVNKHFREKQEHKQSKPDT